MKLESTTAFTAWLASLLIIQRRQAPYAVCHSISIYKLGLRVGITRKLYLLHAFV